MTRINHNLQLCLGALLAITLCAVPASAQSSIHLYFSHSDDLTQLPPEYAEGVNPTVNMGETIYLWASVMLFDEWDLVTLEFDGPPITGGEMYNPNGMRWNSGSDLDPAGDNSVACIALTTIGLSPSDPHYSEGLFRHHLLGEMQFGGDGDVFLTIGGGLHRRDGSPLDQVFFGYDPNHVPDGPLFVDDVGGSTEYADATVGGVSATCDPLVVPLEDWDTVVAPVPFTFSYDSLVTTDLAGPCEQTNTGAHATAVGDEGDFPAYVSAYAAQDVTPLGHFAAKVSLYGEFGLICLDPECLDFLEVPCGGASGGLSGTLTLGTAAGYPAGTPLILTADIAAADSYSRSFSMTISRAGTPLAELDDSSPGPVSFDAEAGETLTVDLAAADTNEWYYYWDATCRLLIESGVSSVVGDLDCDGAVDFDDINPFVLALSGQAGYEAAYPDCNWYNADCDEDGDVDFDDINPFVNILSS